MTQLECVRSFFAGITRIQKRVKSQKSFSDAKVENLISYWDITIMDLQRKQSKIKDKTIQELINKIVLIDPAIRDACLEEYVKKCKELHAIAFMQWLFKYPKKSINLEECEDIFYKRLEAFIGKCKDHLKPLPATTENAKISKGFY
jgi:hypothetical protein